MKSTVEEIRARLDNDVERLSNLDTGQSATIDAPLALELIAEAAATTTPQARRLLDVGCGAGNYSLKLLHALPALDVTLVDLLGFSAVEVLHKHGCFAAFGAVRAEPE